MKTPRVLSVLFSIVLAGIFNTAVPMAQPKGERVTVTGEVVEMWCYLEAGDRGAATKACAAARGRGERGGARRACATACPKVGNPIALIDDKGQLFVLAGLKSHQPAQEL